MFGCSLMMLETTSERAAAYGIGRTAPHKDSEMALWQQRAQSEQRRFELYPNE